MIDEFPSVTPCFKTKMEKSDNKLYDIEIVEVDTARRRMKIHFKGFDKKFDEWRPYDGNELPIVRLDKKFKPSTDFLEDCIQIFNDKLYRAIKRKLYSGRKEDPDTKIELPAEEDVFMAGLGLSAAEKNIERRKQIYRLHSNRELDTCLGVKWDERIMNENGDFAYVIAGTVRFWLMMKAPIIEYKLIGGRYIRSEIEESCQLVFMFVRGDGNKHEYANRV